MPVIAALGTVAGIAADEAGAVDSTINAIQVARGKACAVPPEPTNAVKGL